MLRPFAPDTLSARVRLSILKSAAAAKARGQNCRLCEALLDSWPHTHRSPMRMNQQNQETDQERDDARRKPAPSRCTAGPGAGGNAGFNVRVAGTGQRGGEERCAKTA